MNKYQKFILDKTLCFVSKDMTAGSKAYFNNFINKDGEFEVKQDENYNIKQHFIVLSGLTVSFVELDGVKYESTNFENHTLFDKKMIAIPVDFDKPAKELKLYFIDNFADALSIKLKFVAADKGLYDAKMHDALIKERTKTANIKVSTGADLVNIYFQPCCEEYEKTIIELYLAEGIFQKRPSHSGVAVNYGPPKLIGGNIGNLIGKFKTEEGMLYKSITGLAKGCYAIRLVQLSKDDVEILKTDALFFEIR